MKKKNTTHILRKWHQRDKKQYLSEYPKCSVELPDLNCTLLSTIFYSTSINSIAYIFLFSIHAYFILQYWISHFSWMSIWTYKMSKLKEASIMYGNAKNLSASSGSIDLGLFATLELWNFKITFIFNYHLACSFCMFKKSFRWSVKHITGLWIDMI